MMEYVRLGNTGLKVSRLCLGCMEFGEGADWKVGGDVANQVLKRAWDLGINFFDTANRYSMGKSEEILGRFLKGSREEAVVATKLFNPMGSGPNQRGLSSKHVHWQIGESLRRLQTDYVDLYQIHEWDADVPIEETLSSMNDLVRNGRVLYIGASNVWAWQLAKALHTSDARGYARFVSIQNLYNLLYREDEREMNPFCAAEGVALIPWSPTAGGILSGKYFKDGRIVTTEKDNSRVAPGGIVHARYVGREGNDDIMKRVLELSGSKGIKPSQLAISWLLHKDVTSPIIGTTKLEHLEELVDATQVGLSPKDVAYLEEPYRPSRFMGWD
jgi:aryl-alcohol dehydrogenase-like predicted oxidoreductase